MNTQFKKGVLEMLVLAVLSRKDCYGYELVQEISRAVAITTGTIYPLLSRLKKEQYFENYLVESEEGPPRKYYRITEKGKQHAKGLIKEWNGFSQGVDIILKGGKS